MRRNHVVATLKDGKQEILFGGDPAGVQRDKFHKLRTDPDSAKKYQAVEFAPVTKRLVFEKAAPPSAAPEESNIPESRKHPDSKQKEPEHKGHRR